ncbi:predicted protein [Histoplasma capsulatum H143]|uniref:Uncharacterized protein n=1 Tax=Ajellomyces capsulatus (strain H143) TaxID=544712 RepID=C6HEW6_AJECH|nr:predicted protein [Histoplasma capsulatum H143]
MNYDRLRSPVQPFATLSHCSQRKNATSPQAVDAWHFASAKTSTADSADDDGDDDDGDDDDDCFFNFLVQARHGISTASVRTNRELENLKTAGESRGISTSKNKNEPPPQKKSKTLI